MKRKVTGFNVIVVIILAAAILLATCLGVDYMRRRDDAARQPQAVATASIGGSCQFDPNCNKGLVCVGTYEHKTCQADRARGL